MGSHPPGDTLGLSRWSVPRVSLATPCWNQGEALQLEAPRAPALCTHPVMSSIRPVNGVPRYSIYQQMHVVFGLVLSPQLLFYVYRANIFGSEKYIWRRRPLGGGQGLVLALRTAV